MSMDPVDYAEIENDRIMNGKPRMNRADGFELEDDDLREEVKLEKLDKFVFELMNNHNQFIDGKSFALHECMALIDNQNEIWNLTRWDMKTGDLNSTSFGKIFDDDPLEAAQMAADKLIPLIYMKTITDSVTRVGKLALDIE